MMLGVRRGEGVPELSWPCSWPASKLGGLQHALGQLCFPSRQKGVFKDPFPFFSKTSVRLY